MTTPTTSLSLALSARAAPSGMNPRSATACSTRSLVSGRGLRSLLSTRETEAMDTPATRATSYMVGCVCAASPLSTSRSLLVQDVVSAYRQGRVVVESAYHRVDRSVFPVPGHAQDLWPVVTGT